jgi:DNA-directed RNA polymerase subunit RPC12/RpoP
VKTLPWYKCLKCGHEKWVSEEETNRPIQCTNYHCRSYWMMPLEKYERIVNALMPKVSDDTPIYDILTAVIEILAENGISGQPLKTLGMAANLVREAELRKSNV